MNKIMFTIIIILGIALIVSGVTLWIYPQWTSIHGGWLILLGVAFVAVAEIGGKLKDWRDFLFESKVKQIKSSDQSSSVQIKRNWMIGNNKIKVKGKEADVTDNPMIGGNEISVDESISAKKK